MAFKSARQRKAVMAKLQVERKFPGNFISKVTNPDGTKGGVRILQTTEPGFTVETEKGRFIKAGFRTDTSAIKFAVKRGHKVVTVLD